MLTFGQVVPFLPTINIGLIILTFFMLAFALNGKTITDVGTSVLIGIAASFLAIVIVGTGLDHMYKKTPPSYTAI